MFEREDLGGEVQGVGVKRGSIPIYGVVPPIVMRVKLPCCWS
jgi:hypothetical protein